MIWKVFGGMRWLFSSPIPQAASLQCPFLLMFHSPSLPLPLAILHFSLFRAGHTHSSLKCSITRRNSHLPRRKEGYIADCWADRPTDRPKSEDVLSPDPLRKVQKWQKTLLLCFPRDTDSKVPKFEMSSYRLSLEILISLCV